MPGVYRVEISQGSRAGCQNGECKDAKIKIQKGELRFGTFVTIMEHQTWRWKHWGCVTPQQIYNLKDSVENDLENYLDGYTELDDHDKSKVAKAVEDGHVADDDWRGDLEVNRPGQKGFRTPASKKKAKEEAYAQQATENGDDSPSKPAEKKKRGRPKKEADGNSGDEQSPKKPKAETQRGREIKTEDDLDEQPQQKKGRKKASRSDVKDEPSHGIKVEVDEDNAVAPAAKKRGAARKAAPRKFKAEESDGEDSNPDLRANESDGSRDDEERVAEEVPKAKRGRKPKGEKGEASTASVSKATAKAKQKKAPDSEGPTKSKRSGGRSTRSSAA